MSLRIPEDQVMEAEPLDLVWIKCHSLIPEAQVMSVKLLHLVCRKCHYLIPEDQAMNGINIISGGGGAIM
jgi:hypothetical protein